MKTEQLIERLRNNFAVDNGEILSHLTTLEKRASAGEMLAGAIASQYFDDHGIKSFAALVEYQSASQISKTLAQLSTYRSSTQDSVREE